MKNHNIVSRSFMTCKSNIIIRKATKDSNRRCFSTGLTFKVIKHFARIRYIVLGTAVGTGITVKNKVDEWRENLRVLPDLSKVKSAASTENWNKATQYITENFNTVLNQTRNSIPEIPAFVPKPNLSYLVGFKDQIIDRWQNAKEAEIQSRNDMNVYKIDNTIVPSTSFTEEKYKRKIEDLERIISELEIQNELIKKEMYAMKNIKFKPSKKTLVEMYSEVLDELSNFEEQWNESDHLPKVVVVGDQSSGKTSVLEMLAQARIFPRGAGQMMTRTPVKVTLCEGPFHVAQIQGNPRSFDLKNEDDLDELRKTIEQKMSSIISKGKTVSNKVISMTVKGPGLRRMILVDLPGIISTQTVDMASDTRDLIRDMSRQFMNNPNAIILCIQDGSVDAERSNVTDLVIECDPSGKRTIFVLTKVDMAEKTITNPDRIRQILSGKLFPMKALGYYAVITGNGKNDDSIQNIKEYELNYFSRSDLFMKGIVKAEQAMTDNLSKAISKCFWKMVEESIEQQTSMFKAKRFNLETEWKNSFPRKPEMDRDELFYRARGEILDQGAALSHISANTWESMLMDELWKAESGYVFDKIYLPAAMSEDIGKFDTLVDISLKEWSDRILPQRSMNCANKTLMSILNEQLLKDKSSENFDGVYEKLKLYVYEEAMKRHSWDKKLLEMMRMLQTKSLQDKHITVKSEWDDAITFLYNYLKTTVDNLETDMREKFGPSYFQRLYKWQYLDEIQQRRIAVKSELEFLLNASLNGRHPQQLSRDEFIAVRNNLENKRIQVNNDFIADTWNYIHKRHFLKTSMERVKSCKKDFYLYSQEDAVNETECNDVVLFWRIKQMLKTTSRVLRQQITNTEAQNIQRTIKDILKEVSRDGSKKRELIVGRRVTLAEDLKRVRRMQEKLEEFVVKLKNEKKENRGN